jgi:Rrf2 family protein
MISQTIEYALRAMTYLATVQGDAAASSGVIAEQTQVPRGYLSKVLRDLVIAGLVTSQRGPNGGFTLARAPGTISILDVVNAVDPLERITRCPLGNPDHLELCPLHKSLDQAMDTVERQFRTTTLAALLAGAPMFASRLAHGHRAEAGPWQDRGLSHKPLVPVAPRLNAV